jgi:predicted RNase H-like nuclease (RuvC/YqgF family)
MIRSIGMSRANLLNSFVHFDIQAEAAFKGQIGQLHGELQEQERISASLSAELKKLREGQMGRDGENKILREQVSHLENKIRHFESQAAHLKESSDRAQELLRQNDVSNVTWNLS